MIIQSITKSGDTLYFESNAVDAFWVQPSGECHAIVNQRDFFISKKAFDKLLEIHGIKEDKQ